MLLIGGLQREFPIGGEVFPPCINYRAQDFEEQRRGGVWSSTLFSGNNSRTVIVGDDHNGGARLAILVRIERDGQRAATNHHTLGAISHAETIAVWCRNLFQQECPGMEFFSSLLIRRQREGAATRTK